MHLTRFAYEDFDTFESEWTTRKTTKSPGEKIVKDIKRARRKHYSSEEKIRNVLAGLRGEDSIAELCRREGISQGILRENHSLHCRKSAVSPR